MRSRTMVLIVVILIGAFVMANTDSNAGESHGRSVEEVLMEIREAHGLNPGE